jgi:RimJ/RimL family protein N-acetyltransferase
VEQDPASAAWVTGVIWDERRQVAVGRAGYHGPPDRSGMVEIGYAVDPAYRRRGYARAALEALLRRAAREPRVRTVRAAISPGNVASCRLASQYGFAEAGRQWDLTCDTVGAPERAQAADLWVLSSWEPELRTKPGP